MVFCKYTEILLSMFHVKHYKMSNAMFHVEQYMIAAPMFHVKHLSYIWNAYCQNRCVFFVYTLAFDLNSCLFDD